MLTWLAMLAFCSVIVGILAYLNYGNAEVIFWSQTPIESDAGKIAWIVVSAACLILFLLLAARDLGKALSSRPASRQSG